MVFLPKKRKSPHEQGARARHTAGRRTTHTTDQPRPSGMGKRGIQPHRMPQRQVMPDTQDKKEPLSTTCNRVFFAEQVWNTAASFDCFSARTKVVWTVPNILSREVCLRAAEPQQRFERTLNTGGEAAATSMKVVFTRFFCPLAASACASCFGHGPEESTPSHPTHLPCRRTKRLLCIRLLCVFERSFRQDRVSPGGCAADAAADKSRGLPVPGAAGIWSLSVILDEWNPTMPESGATRYTAVAASSLPCFCGWISFPPFRSTPQKRGGYENAGRFFSHLGQGIDNPYRAQSRSDHICDHGLHPAGQHGHSCRGGA